MRHVMRLLVVVALLGSAGATSASTPAAQPQDCVWVLPASANGAEAITALGSRLADVASLNGMPVDVLRSRLAADPTLWVEPCGRLFYVDAGTGTESAPAATTTPSSAMPFPSSQTFLLHSRPGASRVIFLDFDGETVSGTSWNSYFGLGSTYWATGYDTDDSPSTFSDAERAVVQDVWQRVAEDFAPFDVDVTTEDPGIAAIDRSGSGDTVYGTKALITNDATMYNQCGCGGIAYVGVYDLTSNHQYYQPALVFQRGLGGGTVPKYLAEATSHEVGHNLSLAHDGTRTSGYYEGQGSWAPIMGVGYYRPIVQWSKGEYSRANNTEDDLALMQSHGAPLRPDDYPNTRASAVSLGSGTSLSATGRIGTRTDVDWFSFAGFGSTTVTLTPAPSSPDLDIRVELYNSLGVLVASADPSAATVTYDIASGLGASILVTLATLGTYFIKVDGVGYGDPLTTGYSDYASLGTYSATVSTSTSAPPELTTITVSPSSASVQTAGTQQFSATGLDQFVQPLNPQPSFTWTVSGGGTISTTGLFTAGSIAGGPFNVTAASGGVSGWASVWVTAALADFSLSISPASQSVRQGRAALYTVAISPANGFSGSVSLTVSGLPSGATAVFSPNPATTNSTMTVQTVTGVRGTFILTVTGVSGSLSHTATATLTVTKR